MKSISVTAVVILVLVSIAAFAQRPQDIFGNTELGPNGYIDFYGLPTPPSRSALGERTTKGGRPSPNPVRVQGWDSY